jgi:hypothetical protein
MTRVGAMLRGGAVGALGMYLFDPDQGRRRQALLRDQVTHWLGVAREELETEWRDARNRVQGATAELRRIGAPAPVTDEAIAGRIRARFASLERPGGIKVDVRDGRVHLGGPVLARDAERARRIVRHVRGANELVDELEVHEEPDIPALQGERRRRFGDLPPSARLAAGVATIVAAAPVIRRVGRIRTARGLAMAALGSAMVNVERARQRATENARGPSRGSGTPA